MIKTNLTSKEYEVMKVLWNSKRPLLVSEIFAKTKTISEGSIHAIINKLINKKFIDVVGKVRVVKSPGRLYAPTLSLTEYMAVLTKEVFKYNNRAIDLKELLSFIVKKDKNRNAEYIRAVEEFLNEYYSDEKESKDE